MYATEQPGDGIVAADPGMLPLGTYIRVSNAGQHSGSYLVADTGRAIKGRKVDIFIPDDAEALRFERRRVRVQILDADAGPTTAPAP